MPSKRTIYLFLLLCVSLTTAAEDFLARGCRRILYYEEQTLTRGADSSGEIRQSGGDFYHGDLRQLVVLVSFADRTFLGNETETLAQWDKIFNTKGLAEPPFVGSVHDYFYDQSYGKMSLQFDQQYVQLSAHHSKYGSSKYDDENSQFLVEDVLDILSERAIDWSLYDWNGDGNVNQLLIIYAGKGSSYGGFGGGYDAIWPHQNWLTMHMNPETGERLEARAMTNVDGTTYLVNCYCAVQELHGEGTYGSFGTICHEFSHCFGFPDFYYGTTQYVGHWDLMDCSYYNFGGFCPSNYSAHERWLMGWLTPIELTEATTIVDMPSLSEQGVAYLIRNEGCDSEYYIVENRQQRKWDAGVPGCGILVFHIDFIPSLWVSLHDAPNSSKGLHYVIIPANNHPAYRTSYAIDWPFPYENNTSLTNTSLPAATLFNANADGSMFMNKPLTKMAVDANGLASFDFMGGTTAISVQTVPGSYEVLYDLEPIRIVRMPNGDIKKVMKH